MSIQPWMWVVGVVVVLALTLFGAYCYVAYYDEESS